MAVKQKPFTESFDCLARVHCETCRKSAEWRAKVGAPDECADAFKPSTIVAPCVKAIKPRSRKCSKCGLRKEEKAKLRAMKTRKDERDA